jgi:hypothetical protein
MNLVTGLYLQQTQHWPQKGRVILAQFDDESVVVYQAYRPEIAEFAIKHGYFGGEFKLSRMSWIKPNFLWMMYRSGWASKEGQEVVLAIRILRSAFDEILRQAVYSAYKPDIYESRDAWKAALNASSVRLQWDPDHSPAGGKLDRRAIQLGMRNSVLKSYAQDWIVEIADITEFVQHQQVNSTPSRYDQLVTPNERVYPVSDTIVSQKLQLDHTY